MENFIFRTPSPKSALIMVDFGLAKYFADGEMSSRMCGSIYFLVNSTSSGFIEIGLKDLLFRHRSYSSTKRVTTLAAMSGLLGCSHTLFSVEAFLLKVC